jgi:uncharacterized protein YijF (DUF1287 family)
VRAFVFAVVVGCAWLGQTTVRAQGAPLPDVGIFSDLDPAVRIALPGQLGGRSIHLRVDDAHRLVVVFDGPFPLKAYPLARACPSGAISPPALLAALDGPDATELGALVSRATPVERAAPSKGPTPDDQDGDGIPDPLDVLLGARKLVLNHATYTEGYFRIPYPGGDVPRAVGVCSDTIVRAFRNAGLDLQRRVAEDIRAAPKAYPSVARPNPSIDHRRVKTLLVWFQRHVPEVHDGPLRPGDVVFLDTFPSRPGPDHVGIVSDRIAPSGQPFIINNWTVGYREGEMDLLPSIPVTHRFRIK